MIFQSWSNAGGTKFAGIQFYFYSASNTLVLKSGRNTGSVQGTDWQFVQGTIVVSDGHWHDVAGVFDGTSLKIYVDNKLDNSIAWANAPAYGATNYIQIGASNDSGTPAAFIGGNINNVSLLSVAMTDFSDHAKDITGTTGLISWWRFNDGSGTTLTDSANAHNGTLVNTPTWSTDVPFTTYWSIANSVQVSQTKFFTDANLVSLYKLEDTSDSKGANTLTNNGGATFAPAKYGNGADMGASNTSKYLSVASNLGIAGNSDMTFAGWLKLDTEITAGVYVLLQHDTLLTAARYLQVYYQYNAGNRALTLVAAGNGINYPITLGTTNLVHVLATRITGSSLANLYVNGSFVATIGLGTSSAGDDALKIGNDGTTNYASAIFDDVPVFNRSFSDADAMDLYVGASATITVNISDTITLNEKLNLVTSKNISDSISLVETLFHGKVVLQTINESISLIESIVRYTTKAIVESVPLTEFLFKKTTKIMADSIPLTENVTTLKSRIIFIVEKVTLYEKLYGWLNNNIVIPWRDKYASRGTTFSDKYTKQNTQWTDKYH